MNDLFENYENYLTKVTDKLSKLHKFSYIFNSILIILILVLFIKLVFDIGILFYISMNETISDAPEFLKQIIINILNSINHTKRSLTAYYVGSLTFYPLILLFFTFAAVLASIFRKRWLNIVLPILFFYSFYGMLKDIYASNLIMVSIVSIMFLMSLYFEKINNDKKME